MKRETFVPAFGWCYGADHPSSGASASLLPCHGPVSLHMLMDMQKELRLLLAQLGLWIVVIGARPLGRNEYVTRQLR